jgi:broad specificity phosphatase PhoE
MILVRHGQSAWNAVFNQTRVDPGIPDPPLTTEGRQQAAAAAEALARLQIDQLLVSPYVRTLETAEIIALQLGVPVAVEPLVRERAAYSCDIGTPRSALAARWPRLSFANLDEVWWPAGLETEGQLQQRCGHFLSSMTAAAGWRRVAVISHWGFIRGLTGVEAHNGQIIRFEPAVAS